MDIESSSNSSNTNSGFFNKKTYNKYYEIKDKFIVLKSLCSWLYSIQLIFSIIWLVVSFYILVPPLHCLLTAMLTILQAIGCIWALRWTVE